LKCMMLHLASVFVKLALLFVCFVVAKSGFQPTIMVVGESNEFSQCELKIYDLETVKNPKSTENDLLVRTVTMEFKIKGIVMDEAFLIC
jgi:hypothetical protein